MVARDGCVTKDDARRRRCNKRRHNNQPANRGKREEMCQQTRDGGVLIGRGCGRGKVERTRGRGVDTTTSRQLRDNHGGGKGEDDDKVGKKFHAATITGLDDDQPGPHG